MDNLNKTDRVAIDTFVEYLKIPSVQPNIDYAPCVAFLRKLGADLQLDVAVHEVAPGKPVVLLTWPGAQPAWPSILLNSHMDVVPVYPERWTHPPFSAHIDAAGNIYARGAQDMKCVGVQYVEAIRRLQAAGRRLARTLHVCFVPDEEIGGHLGMALFVKSKEYAALNIGFALDEGMACPDEDFILFYGERCIWHMDFHIPGQPGHGSLLAADTAGEKMRRLVDRIYDFRDAQVRRLAEPTLTIGDVHTLNVTRIAGGVQNNVVPAELVVSVDCRIPVTTDMAAWAATVERWCREAGDGVHVTYEQKDEQIPATRLDNTNPYWLAFDAAAKDLGIKFSKRIFPGGTDSRYVRAIGTPALGFSPMNRTPVLLHDDDEFLNAAVFLKGIEYYCSLIPAVADVPERTG